MENKKSFIYNLLISIGVIILADYSIGNPILDFLFEFATLDVEGKVIESYHDFDYGDSYKYTYTVDNITYIKGTSDFDEDVDPKEPIEVVIEYVYFMPSLSKLKGTGYSSRSSYFIRSLFIKTLFYISLIVYFIRLLKKDLLLIKNVSEVNSVIEYSGFNLKKNLISSILDIIIGISAFSLTLLLSNIFKGDWVGIIILLFLFFSFSLHVLTKRIVDTNIALIITVVSGLITINGGNNFNEFNNFHWNHYILISYVVIKFSVLRFLLEYLLIKWGFDVEYKLYDLLTDKLYY